MTNDERLRTPSAPSGQQPHGPSSPNSPSASFYDRLRSLGISLDPEGKWFAGVCTGIARRFGVDPTIVRVAFIILTVAFGAGVSLYLLAWLVLPDRDGSVMLERAVRHGEGGPIFLIIVLGLSVLGDLSGPTGDRGNYIGLAVVAGGLWWFFTRTDQGRTMRASMSAPAAPNPTWPAPTTAPGSAASGGMFVGTQPGPVTLTPGNAAAAAGARVSSPMPPTTAPAPRRVTRGVGFFASLLIGGAALLVGGLLIQNGVSALMGLTVAVGIVGLAIVIAGVAGRRGGWLTLGALVGLVALALSAGPANAISRYGADTGDKQVSVTTVQDGRVDRLGAGSFVVDYSKVDTSAPGLETVSARVGVGELKVIVPQGKSVAVNSRVFAGELDAQGRTQSGMQLTAHEADNETPDLVIDAEVGVGQLTITTAP